MFQKFGEQRIAIPLLLHGPPRCGEFSWRYFIGFPSRISGESNSVLQIVLIFKRRASSDDAGFLETEIAISPRGGSADDDVIQQLEL